jgi:predicted O-linked N-acetylglucosamine transferase (SPINDLY family)
VDIALDTFPYNGATTTCEALWMGVPVVSLSGSTHASRMGLSILTAAGRSEWAAADTAEFVARCVALAQDQQRLMAERAGLRAIAASPLMDEVRYVRAFEQLLSEVV